jgi:DNA repair protein RadC
MNSLPPKLTIKHLSEEDRPREKLLTKGRRTLTDAELLAILIGSGSRTESAVQLCQRILQGIDNNLHHLARLEVKQLMQYKGIGEAKAISIVAALEIGRRRKDEVSKTQEPINSSKRAYSCFLSQMQDLPHEEFWVLLLNRANIPLALKMVGSGGVSSTLVDVKIVLKLAIEHLASAVIIAHNHPSGNLTPSEADLKLTKKIKAGCDAVDIPLIDHLIVTDKGYYSFCDEGEL